MRPPSRTFPSIDSTCCGRTTAGRYPREIATTSRRLSSLLDIVGSKEFDDTPGGIPKLSSSSAGLVTGQCIAGLFVPGSHLLLTRFGSSSLTGGVMVECVFHRLSSRCTLLNTLCASTAYEWFQSDNHMDTPSHCMASCCLGTLRILANSFLRSSASITGQRRYRKFFAE